MKAKQQGQSSQSQPRKRSLFDRLKSRFTTTFGSSKSQERRVGAPAGDPPAAAHTAEVAILNKKDNEQVQHAGVVQTAAIGT